MEGKNANTVLNLHRFVKVPLARSLEKLRAVTVPEIPNTEHKITPGMLDIAKSEIKEKAMNRIIEEMNRPAQTDIIERAKKRMNAKDKAIFDMLPISEADKEAVLFDLYGSGSGSNRRSD